MCDGAEIPYEGRMIKRGAPERDDYLRLAARSTEHVEVDLSNAYRFPAAKECRVRFKGRIHDVVADARQVPRAMADHSPVDIDGDAVVFELQIRRLRGDEAWQRRAAKKTTKKPKTSRG